MPLSMGCATIKIPSKTWKKVYTQSPLCVFVCINNDRCDTKQQQQTNREKTRIEKNRKAKARRGNRITFDKRKRHFESCALLHVCLLLHISMHRHTPKLLNIWLAFSYTNVMRTQFEGSKALVDDDNMAAADGNTDAISMERFSSALSDFVCNNTSYFLTSASASATTKLNPILSPSPISCAPSALWDTWCTCTATLWCQNDWAGCEITTDSRYIIIHHQLFRVQSYEGNRNFIYYM